MYPTAVAAAQGRQADCRTRGSRLDAVRADRGRHTDRGLGVVVVTAAVFGGAFGADPLESAADRRTSLVLARGAGQLTALLRRRADRVRRCRRR